jgi:alpha,alpha-trehalase
MVEAGNIDIVQYMVDNYTHLIDEIGYVPSSNRTYNATYSQPPFFTSMVELLASAKGEETIIKYYPQIRKEYNYWMKMTDALSDENVDSLKVVKVDNYILNRYRDENPWPRADQYRNDVSLASNVDWRQNWEVFRDLRGGAESGWNFTGRWFSRRWRSTIMTSEILPVDLNSILFHIEKTLYDCYQKLGNQGEEMRMKEAMEKRKEAINTIFWDDENGIYADYEYGDTTVRDCPSLAMAYPLFFEIASQEQADSVAQYIQDKFLAQGGVVSSTMDYGQRWDYPNGWPHLHWITVIGLDQYGHQELAKDIAERWIGLIEKVYRDQGRFLEYYNVVEFGENEMDDDYPSDGYGPTIGVYLALKKYLDN